MTADGIAICPGVDQLGTQRPSGGNGGTACSAGAVEYLATAPTAPQGVAAAAHDQSVTLTWTPSTSDGGSPVTGYDVYEGTTPGGESTTPVNATPISPTTTSYTVGTLNNGTKYYFTVKAVNGVGTSAASTEASATPATVPGMPGTPTGVAANKSVVVSWTAPATDGGSPVTSYTVTSSPTAKTCTWTATTTTGKPLSCTVPGLTNTEPYTFTVVATNSQGPGTASTASATVTPHTTVPGAPTAVFATRGDHSATVTWTAPSTDGGTAITKYTVTPYAGVTAGTPVTVTCPCSATTATVTGLTNGTAYTFTVSATNGIGPSQPSTKSAAVTPAGKPTAPTNVRAAAGTHQVTLSWTPATTNGTALTYVGLVYLAATTTKAVSTCIVGPSTTSCAVSELTNGVQYVAKVVAVNNAGSSGSAFTSPVTPVGRPTAPTNVTAIRGTRSVTVSWTASTLNGTTSTSGYEVLAYLASTTSKPVNSCAARPSARQPARLQASLTAPPT